MNLCRHAVAYRNTARPSSLFDYDDFDIAFATDQADADIVRVTLDQKVNRPRADAQSVDPNLFEPRGQYGPEQADLMRGASIVRPRHACKSRNTARQTRPGCAGHWIERGPSPGRRVNPQNSSGMRRRSIDMLASNIPVRIFAASCCNP